LHKQQKQGDKLANILVIDDSKIMRFNIRKVLEELGHTIIAEGVNTFECVKHVERSKNEIDMVFLDIIMPRAQGYLDGIDAIKHIRAIDANMPILVLTCDAKQQTVVSAIKEGASDYILKPISLEKVKSSIEYVQRLRSNIGGKEFAKTQNVADDIKTQNADNQAQSMQSPKESQNTSQDAKDTK